MTSTPEDSVLEEEFEDEATPLTLACEDGNLQEVKRLIDNGTDPLADENKTCLFHACCSKNLSLVKYLMEEKHVDIKNCYEAFTYACYDDMIAVVKYLVEEAHTNVNSWDKHGETPLVHACVEGQLQTVKYLVEHSANVELKEKGNRTCLMHACRNNHLPVVKYLIEEVKANVEEVDGLGHSCLVYAYLSDNLSLVEYLVEEVHVNIMVEDNMGYTCFSLACREGNLPFVKYFADKMDENSLEINLIHAFHSCDLPTIQYLIEEKHINVTAKPVTEVSYFMKACFCEDYVPTVKYLVEKHSIDIEEKDSRGRNALMYACEKNHFRIVKYLIEEMEANVKVEDNRGLNCLHYACMKDNLEIAKYLIIDCWMKPPSRYRFTDPSLRLREFIQRYDEEYVSVERGKKWTQLNKSLRGFLRGNQLKGEWDSHQTSVFIQGIPLYVTHVQELMQSNPGHPADLTVRLPTPAESCENGQRKNLVYAKKKALSESGSFMSNLLTGEMNDVKNDPDHAGMQTVELSPELLQDCPVRWLKQLISFLSWSREGDHIQHYVNPHSEKTEVSFDEIVEALKYCRMCNALSIETDTSSWTRYMTEKMAEYNTQWIESTLQRKTNVQYCISNIPRIDSEMYHLLTQALGETDALYFFMLVNAAPASIKTRSTIATECREWLLSDKSSGKYKGTLKNSFFVAALHFRINFNFETGEILVPLLKKEREGEEEEEFVPRKRRRIE